MRYWSFCLMLAFIIQQAINIMPIRNNAVLLTNERPKSITKNGVAKKNKMLNSHSAYKNNVYTVFITRNLTTFTNISQEN